MATFQKIFKIISIVTIVSGAASIIQGICYFPIAALALAWSWLYGAGTGIVIILAGILAIVVGLFDILVGVLGVKNAYKPEKAGKCMTWGVIAAAASLLIIILSIIGSMSFGHIFWTIVDGMLIPAAYVVFAYLIKKKYVEAGNVSAPQSVFEQKIDNITGKVVGFAKTAAVKAGDIAENVTDKVENAMDGKKDDSQN